MRPICWDCARLRPYFSARGATMSSTRKPSENEEEYFARMELERRKKWEVEQASKRTQEEKDKLKQLHWMKCPKCGSDLHTLQLKGLDVDRCPACNGTWFDAGEMEQLLEHDQTVLGRLKRVFG
jgi:predicted Zn-ribbon and HTH transcriptional regulator